MNGLRLDFSDALRELKRGHKLARDGWNGKGMHVQAQYPDQLSKMERPYFFIDPGEGWRVPWVPSVNDLTAEDWHVVEGTRR
jgi:hypothetical protein